MMRINTVTTLVALEMCLRSRGVQEEKETFGCKANPTGNPIGGGEDYKPIFTDGDFVVRTKMELLQALKKARDGQVVFVPHGVEFDLTGERDIQIPGGVTLAGTRGLDSSPGARIFTTWRETHVLMQTAGYDARLTGLRFEGAYGGAQRVSDHSGFVSINHSGAEVDNCEIYNFPVRGIDVDSTAINVHICIRFARNSALASKTNITISSTIASAAVWVME